MCHTIEQCAYVGTDLKERSPEPLRKKLGKNSHVCRLDQYEIAFDCII